MKTVSAIKNISQAALDPFETLNSQVAKPMLDEIAAEFGFGGKSVGKIPKTIASEELSRAREKQKLDQMHSEDIQKSKEVAERVFASIQQTYRQHAEKTKSAQHELKTEIVELQNEVAKLAKTAGVNSKAHLENIPKKVGILDIKRLTFIVRLLRIKADESKSAQDLVSQRTNAKQATGMLAWVSGKQMKVHEQGTLQLQG